MRPAIGFDEKAIDTLFAELNQCHLPGAAVGIAINGVPVYRKGFGLASMELSVVLSPSLRMRIGSTSKHFTALAYLLLCEEGLASVDDPIGKYLPELHRVHHGVTLRQLLGNVGGLRDVCDISLRFNGAGRPISNHELLGMYAGIDDANAAPGTAWIYNNGGYLLVSAAIERIAGQPLEEVLRRKVFEPVGMHDTLLRRFDTDFVPGSATLHMMNPAGHYDRSYFGLDFAGAGTMVSTVDDMLRWMAHMDTPVIGRAETWATLKTSQTLANGTPTGYGCGLILGRYRGVETLSHPGGGMGGNAQMLKVPAHGLDIAVMANRHDVLSMKLALDIVDACLTDLDPIEEESSAPFACGTFLSPATGRVVQLFTEADQQKVSIDGFDLPFACGPDHVLRPVPMWSFIKRSLTLVGTPDEPVSIRLDDFGNIDELVRVKLPAKAGLGTYAGRYRSDATGCEAVLCESGHGARLIATGRFGSAPYDLVHLGECVWRARPASPMNLGGVVSISKDGTELQFFSYGNRALPFRRCG